MLHNVELNKLIDIHLSLPSQTFLPAPTPSLRSRLSEHQFELPASYIKFSLAICFAYGNVCISRPLFQFIYLDK